MTIQRIGDRADYEVSVQPIQGLGKTALLSGAFSLLPLFAVLIWLTVGFETLPVVVASEIAVTAAFFVVYVRFRRVFAAVNPTVFVKRRMLLPGVSVERARVDRVLIHRVYRAHSIEALPQLIALDHDGGRLFALSGLYWSHPNIDRIAKAMALIVDVDDRPISRADYYRVVPTARLWYSTKQFGLAVLGSAAAALLVASALALALSMSSTSA